MRTIMRRPLLVVAVTLIALAISAKEQNVQWWQLALQYNSSTISLVSAKPFEEPRKQVKTPGLKGAPLQLDFEVDWLDSSRSSLFQTTTTLPLGVRTTLNSPGPNQTLVPDSDIIVLRVKGPAPNALPATLRMNPISRRLRSTAPLDAPAVLQMDTLNLTIPAGGNISPPPGPISATKVRDTGTDSNRLVIAVMGDGFTASDLASGLFQTHTNVLLDAFTHKSPYNIYFNATNVYRVDMESNESGADEPSPGPGIYKDTYLNSSFWTNGIERLLTIDSTGKARAIAAADSLIGVGVWDSIFVLVNSSRYGGAGGPISVSSIHSSSREIIIHEFGHTFAGLADEYYDSTSARPDNDDEPNVDFQYTYNDVKWNYWIEPGVPLPTPENSIYGNTVGAFEGAKYHSKNIYRPWENCVMRVLGAQFCPVCKEATVLSYTNLLNLADSQQPPASETVMVGSGGVEFSVSPLPITPLAYVWKINGTPLPDEISSTVHLFPSHLTNPNNILTIEIKHPTTLVRKESIVETKSWTVAPVPSAISKDIWSLY